MKTLDPEKLIKSLRSAAKSFRARSEKTDVQQEHRIAHLATANALDAMRIAVDNNFIPSLPPPAPAEEHDWRQFIGFWNGDDGCLREITKYGKAILHYKESGKPIQAISEHLIEIFVFRIRAGKETRCNPDGSLPYDPDWKGEEAKKTSPKCTNCGGLLIPPTDSGNGEYDYWYCKKCNRWEPQRVSTASAPVESNPAAPIPNHVGLPAEISPIPNAKDGEAKVVPLVKPAGPVVEDGDYKWKGAPVGNHFEIRGGRMKGYRVGTGGPLIFTKNTLEDLAIGLSEGTLVPCGTPHVAGEKAAEPETFIHPTSNSSHDRAVAAIKSAAGYLRGLSRHRNWKPSSAADCETLAYALEDTYEFMQELSPAHDLLASLCSEENQKTLSEAISSLKYAASINYSPDQRADTEYKADRLSEFAQLMQQASRGIPAKPAVGVPVERVIRSLKSLMNYEWFGAKEQHEALSEAKLLIADLESGASITPSQPSDPLPATSVQRVLEVLIDLRTAYLSHIDTKVFGKPESNPPAVAAEKLILALESGSLSPWRSVKDGLPKNRDAVIVNNGQYVFTAWSDGNQWEATLDREDRISFLGTWWMPIPPLPQEKKP